MQPQTTTPVTGQGIIDPNAVKFTRQEADPRVEPVGPSYTPDSVPGPRQSDAKARISAGMDKFSRSRDYMYKNYYPEWQEVYRQYLCVAESRKDQNDMQRARAQSLDGRWALFGPDERLIAGGGEDDNPAASIVVPDIWALTRRKVARLTGNIPNLRHRSQDAERMMRVSRCLMYQYEHMDRKLEEKKHLTQAQLFGWSVKSWYWERNEFLRTVRVDPTKPMEPEIKAAVMRQYGQLIESQLMPQAMMDLGIDPQMVSMIGQRASQGDPQAAMAMETISGQLESHALMLLVGKVGQGKRIRVQYPKLGYVGPKYDTLLLCDVFPLPGFVSLQQSGWFAVTRRRDLGWFKRLKLGYEGDEAFRADQVDEMLKRMPHGGHWDFGPRGGNDGGLRRQFEDVSNRGLGNERTITRDETDAFWNVLEIHYTGDNCGVEYIAEGAYWFGKLDYPFALENNKIPFTELKFVVNLLDGVGESGARIISPITRLHGEQASMRHELVGNLIRPLVTTTDKKLMDNPGRLKRGLGMRLVQVEDHGDLQVHNESAAQGAAMTGIQNEGTIVSHIQAATGENNMSTAANADPAQNKTATGATITQAQLDILTKEELEMYQIGQKADITMMRELNASELNDDITFDAAPYSRDQESGGQSPEEQRIARLGPQIVTVTPEDFHSDGDIEPEVGSTLADDDDTNVNRALQLFGTALQSNGLFNLETARERLLVAFGEGKRIQQWMPPPAPPPPPPEMRISASISVKLETLRPEYQEAILAKIMSGEIPAEGTMQAPGPGLPSSPSDQQQAMSEGGMQGGMTSAAMGGNVNGGGTGGIGGNGGVDGMGGSEL